MDIAALKAASQTALARSEISIVDPRAILSLIARLEALEEALRSIEAWEMPDTGKFWTNQDGSTSDRPMSYAAAYGSNGERDHIKSIARAALEPVQS